MNLQGEHDLVVVRTFEGADAFFGFKRGLNQQLDSWQEKVKDRLSNLSMFRRFDLSAQGTSHLAFYSDLPYAATDIMLTIKNCPAEGAKALCLWLNSTPNIVQTLVERIETRGTFMETPVFVSERLLVPNLLQMGPQATRAFIQTFDRVSAVEFPSLLDQLNNHFGPRVEMDMTVLQALGFPKQGLREFVRKLQRQCLDEILKLKDLMGG